MPKFGNSSSRPGAGDRKPRHGKPAGAAKPREDGREGRSPQRKAFFEAKTEAPRSSRPSEGRPAGRTEHRRDYDERPRRDFGDRDTRGAAPRGDRDGRRDWSPRDDRAPRTDRPAWGRDRDNQAPRDSAPRDGGRSEGRRDWAPREDRPRGQGGDRPAWGNRDDRGPRRDFGDRDSRPAAGRGDRPAWGNRDRDDRAPRRDFDDRAPRRDFGDRDSRPAADRSDRPAWGNRDDRGPRRDFGDRDNRGPRREFSDRPSNGRPDRADRVERDNSRERSFSDRRDSNPNKKAFFEDEVLERLTSVSAEEAVITESFGEMGLHEKLVTQLEAMGAATPFPIQAATIPAAITGKDVLGRGKTGSGKTIAFTVPIVTKLVNGGSQPRKPNKPRALILAPTRELAEQIDRTASQLARAVGFYTTTVYGGVPQRKQEIAMSRGVDILVATPGRLEDLMAQRIVDLSEVETIVIDEADHMCDLGFIAGVRRIMAATGDSQKLLFSATLDKEVDALVREFMPAPYVYEVPNEADDTANIEHRVLIVQDQDKSQVLLRLVQGKEKALIFVRTKASAENLSESLTAAGVPAARLHGDLNQNQRTRNLERFTRGAVRVLVATDVAARGIHVDDVALVIQLDPPLEYKTYLHRSGRTGRGGKHGTVVTLVPRQRRRKLEDLLHRAERDGIFTDVWPGHELLETLAGEIAPPPAVDILDFGGRGRDGRENPGGGRSRGGYKGGSGSRPERKGNYGGSGKGRWADRPAGTDRPRAKKRFED
ncbi:MAG: hypothetical protein RL556_313 [Actinomycetota bacterium]